MNNAAKEAKETKKWIEMLVVCNFIKEDLVKELLRENDEIISILVTICKNAAKNKKHL